MSHITKIELQIKDLQALKKAFANIGMEFCEGVTSFKWYGQRGKCDHVAKIKGKEGAYEVGINKEKDGSYSLQCDFYDHTLAGIIGNNGCKIKQQYAKEVVKKNFTGLMMKGFKLRESVKNDEIHLSLEHY